MTLAEFCKQNQEKKNLFEFPMKESDGNWYKSVIEYEDMTKASAFNGQTVKFKGESYQARFKYPEGRYPAQLLFFPATERKQASFSASDIS